MVSRAIASPLSRGDLHVVRTHFAVRTEIGAAVVGFYRVVVSRQISPARNEADLNTELVLRVEKEISS